MTSKWRTAVIHEIERSKSMPFAYGSHDCLQFASRCWKARTGIDHAASFGEYTDPAELLEQHGGVQGILTTVLGEMHHPVKAGDGSIVLAEIGGQHSAGVCMSGQFFFARDPVGLATLPRRVLIGCWP